MIRQVTASLRKQVGVTMVELVIVMAIIGLLAAIAVPNIMEFIKTSRVSAQTDALVNTFALARLKAISDRKVITVCASDDPDANDNCSAGTDWSRGWVVKDGAVAISRFKANANSVQISFTDPAKAFLSVDFSKSLGSAALTGGGAIEANFKFCGKGLEHKEQYVSLAPSGRAVKSVSANVTCPK
ncbi:GspH/FimT family pseudopilin [Chitinimonas sp. BJB300]|uniref:GspH/FimT family pseudopilin n=1 Tax=Chitinimonas sp. BJB300 TaxID=1559339 RepID=UPI002101A862|nr:GspH/FimT family pseudopilin [Chitinimonas sp. BJB300]